MPIRWALVAVGLTCCMASAQSPAETAAVHGTSDPVAKRPFSVRDSIELRRIVKTKRGEIATVSPDRSKFFLMLKRGDLDRNAVTYELRVYESADVVRALQTGGSSQPVPYISLSRSTVTNEPAFAEIRWLDDRERLMFIGRFDDRPGALCEWRIGAEEPECKAVPGDVTTYDTSSGVAVAAVAVARNQNERKEQDDYGFVASLEDVRWQLGIYKSTPSILNPFQYWALHGSGSDWQLLAESKKPFFNVYSYVAMSPTGRHAVVARHPDAVPARWARYLRSPRLESQASELDRSPDDPLVTQFYVADIRTGNVRPAVAAPRDFTSYAIWMDEERVLLVGTFMPGGNSPVIAEVDISTGEARSVMAIPPFYAKDRIGEVSWNRERRRLTVKRIAADTRKPLPDVVLRPTSSGWEVSKQSRREGPAPCVRLLDRCAAITQHETFNSAPVVRIEDRASGRSTILLDPNPQIRRFHFGAAGLFEWHDESGREWRGTLIRPVDYAPGRRYPLVIQTHGFRDNEFLTDGPHGWASAFAAQPLANAGFVVLQVQDKLDLLSTRNEGRGYLQAYESAVAALDDQGLIDTDRVGIIGFSRTVFHVLYALTHSRVRFAAATLCDGIDVGFTSYFTLSSYGRRDYESIVGALPSGAGLQEWLRESPGFNLERVTAPVRLEGIGRGGPTLQLQTLVTLKVLGRPVELILIPQGSHPIERPGHRVTSQQGNVDWFRFWLKDEEDASPGKVEQYARWGRMRDDWRAKQARGRTNRD